MSSSCIGLPLSTLAAVSPELAQWLTLVNSVSLPEQPPCQVQLQGRHPIARDLLVQAQGVDQPPHIGHQVRRYLGGRGGLGRDPVEDRAGQYYEGRARLVPDLDDPRAALAPFQQRLEGWFVHP